MSSSNKAIVLKEYIQPGAAPQKNNFDTRTLKRPELTGGDKEVIVQSLYLSVDPYMKLQMKSEGLFKPFVLGDPLYGCGIGRVVESNHPNYCENDVIVTLKEWDWPTQEYVLFNQSNLSSKKKIPADFDPKKYSSLIGCLGLPGLTAYFGFFQHGKPKAGETMVVSGATGTVGSIVGQIGKLFGLTVVGFASNQDKADYLKNELGFDDVVITKNATREDITRELKQKCPSGIDIYFDNVGGEVSNGVYSCMNRNGRVPIGVQISRYNDSHVNENNFDETPDDVAAIIKDKSIYREFFFVNSSKSDFDTAFDYLFNNLNQGNLKFKENIYDGIEKWSDAFISNFESQKTGKAVVKV